MEVNNTVNTGYTAPAATTNTSTTAAAASSATTTTTTPKAEETPAVVYESSTEISNSKLDTAAKLRLAIDETNKSAESFREMIKKLIGNQAKKNSEANGLFGKQSQSEAYDDLLNKISNGENVMVEVDAETRAAAQKDIEAGGYYSVEKTGDRILDFADAYAGTDPAKLKTMQDAFEKGYKQAEEMWGGKLPQISKDTYDYVMKGFAERMNPTSAAE